MTRKSSICHSALFFLGCCLAIPTLATAAETLQVVSYQSPEEQNSEGVRYFAASVAPLQANAHQATDVVVLVDTSASQTGMYRDTSLAAVEACLESLDRMDRFCLIAADLDARPLTDGLEAVEDFSRSAALQKLQGEAPLGSTDLVAALETSARILGGSKGRARTVLLIGDGLSTGKVIGGRLEKLINTLRDSQISVSSYSIGPKRDNAFLAALANQTGGNLYVDDPMAWADESAGISTDRATAENVGRGARVGRILADWAHATVAWPSETKSNASILPAEMLPLRSDRDTVVLGKIEGDAQEITLSASLGDQTLEWTGTLGQDDEANAYLAQLVEQAEQDRGLTLTTLGTAGLQETGRSILAEVEGLTQLAERAASLGDKEGALRISEAVLRRDPGNLRAQTVQFFGENDFDGGDFGQGEAIEAPPVEAPAAAGELNLVRPAQELNAPPVDGFVDTGAYPPAEVVVDGRFLNSVDRNSSVYAQLLEKEVQNTVADARDIMSSNPDAATQQLKLMLLNVERAPELVSSVRAGLIDKIQMALREAARQAEIKDDLDREREARLAATREQRLLLDRLALRQEREKQLLERVTSLVDERRYKEAHEVAAIAEQNNLEGVVPRAARIWTEQKQYHEFNVELRRRRAENFIAALAQVEMSAIPFPDEPPIVYPDPEFWAELTERRKQYAAVDLAGKSESEEAISAALTSPLTSAGLDFQDTPLEEIVAFLRDEYEIEIQLDTQALDDFGLGPDEPVSVNLRNISLRSAMRLMLKPLELTYVIDDEVLLITTEDEALTRLSVKVYPVADLVLPVVTPQVSGIGGGLGGGGGGGGFGGGGGGLGGGGGGFGGGGGGLGGGGGGFGGGGGAFSVPDTTQAVASEFRVLNFGPVQKAEKAEPVEETIEENPEAAPAEPMTQTADPTLEREDRLALPEGEVSAAYWEEYFTNAKPRPADVRDAVRRLLSKRQFDQVVSLIEAALRNGQPQSWMYESLGIAMQLDGRSEQEVERAVMSAVDFADNSTTLLAIADYLTSLDLDRRAAQVCRLAAERDPMLREAYAIGLHAAQRADDQQAIQWATISILGQVWPEDQSAIVDAARSASAELMAKYTEAGELEKAEAFRNELNQAEVRDCQIIVSWTGDADVDIAVEEPGGTLCSLGQPRTTSGGVCLGGNPTASEGDVHSETYVCPRGFSGDYRLAVRKVWGDLTADVVTVEVKLGLGTDNELSQSDQIKLVDGKDAVVEFQIADGRRTDAIEEHQIAQAIIRQQAVSQAVLAQQISSLADEGPTSLRPDDARRRRRALAQQGRGVGFQPQIITLPNGTNFQTTAVISADRRYVRVTPVPFFSGVSEVSSFTFASAGGNVTNNVNATTTTTNNTTDVTNVGGNAGDGG